MVKETKPIYYLTPKERVYVVLLKKVICEVQDIPDMTISNEHKYAVARVILCWLLHTYSTFGKMSLHRIASMINRDYRSVKSHLKNHGDWYLTDPEYREVYHQIGKLYSQELQRLGLT